jgi:hypothetical protein
VLQSSQIPGSAQDIELNEEYKGLTNDSSNSHGLYAPKISKNNSRNSEAPDQLASSLIATCEAGKDMLEINNVCSSAPEPVSSPFGRHSKKRKNAERSVSPIYNDSRVIGFSTSTPISATGLAPPTNPKAPSTENSSPLCGDALARQPRGPGDCAGPRASHVGLGRDEDLEGSNAGYGDEGVIGGLKWYVKGCKCLSDYENFGPLWWHEQILYGLGEEMNEDAVHPDTNHSNVASRPGSVSSRQSERGRGGFRDMLRRRSGVPVAASPGHEGITFDSRSGRSVSQVSLLSNTSCASGRRSPSNEWARAGMKAVKAIRACWRCKL